ncbi:ketopantoate reductase family protein [Rhizobium binae]|uniref:ketopantoate reductase family protein n=1 Tax=Rhizobium binae TaxID=1138190 RepID=UPI001C8291E8|nr:ketopantoate reductase family protein [Rhizobium binae]MBX4929967.1 ketopantoate reductase family protein [Rhizobium binae]MBX4939771.1 ketopantoate reductase family protein [Rhizobium binae]MBX4946290.1 ketopantoate reductase family protein [Rhizobium binae]MBX4952505.1 ketopantoate reductase family protein [Rhizobium binae]MBX4961121.1 ketopantoate reductase family protein [Rhizobium binae]
MADRTSKTLLRIGVVGAGAMGSLFGGCLFEGGGADVTLIDINPAHIGAIREHGLRIVDDRGDRLLDIPTVTPDAVRGTFDLVLVFTKTLHTRSALAGIAGTIGPETYLFSLQNGLENKETLLEFAAPDRVLIGVTTYPADIKGPGHVESHGEGVARFAAAASGEPPISTALIRAFEPSGLRLVYDPDVEAAIWEKVAFNAALNSICAITRSTVGQVGADEGTRSLVFSIVGEVCRTAIASGIAADIDHVEGMVEHALSHHTHHKPSMLQDLLAGRLTEIETINGAVVRKAVAAGIETPVTSVVLKLVRHVQSPPQV